MRILSKETTPLIDIKAIGVYKDNFLEQMKEGINFRKDIPLRKISPPKILNT